MRGRFITVEGPEGAGKTTLIPSIRAQLEASGRRVLVVRTTTVSLSGPGTASGAIEIQIPLPCRPSSSGSVRATMRVPSFLAVS